MVSLCRYLKTFNCNHSLDMPHTAVTAHLLFEYNGLLRQFRGHSNQDKIIIGELPLRHSQSKACFAENNGKDVPGELDESATAGGWIWPQG